MHTDKLRNPEYIHLKEKCSYSRRQSQITHITSVFHISFNLNRKLSFKMQITHIQNITYNSKVHFSY